jgi:hypothetical protein
VVFLQQVGQHISVANFKIAPSLQLGLCDSGAWFGKHVLPRTTTTHGSLAASNEKMVAKRMFKPN